MFLLFLCADYAILSILFQPIPTNMASSPTPSNGAQQILRSAAPSSARAYLPR